ncbi:hypothetical protein AAVH_34147 [Aphelenchoides avenae]|nr:hypothetical protein AAVH_34147 [Aphelenchus avenae]
MSSTPSFVLVALVVLALSYVALSMPAQFFNDDADMGMGSELAGVLRVRRNAASSMIGWGPNWGSPAFMPFNLYPFAYRR